MSRLSLLSLLLAASSACATPAPIEVGGEAAWSRPKAAVDPAPRDADFPLAQVASTPFAPIDPARIEAVRRANAEPGLKALQIGVQRNLDEVAQAAAPVQWRVLPDGSHATRLEAVSPGAESLRVALTFGQLPEAAQLRFFGTDPARAEAVVDGAEIARQLDVDPLYWTPITTGERQTIEVWLPAGADTRWTAPRTRALSHLFVAPAGSLKGAKVDESDFCENNVRCLLNPSQADLDAKNSVARMAFQTSSGTGLCTGTLLNDTDASTQVPHFFSAAHCFTQQNIANTLVTYWFFEKTTVTSGNSCQVGGVDPAAVQLTGGATVRYASGASDVLFLRLNSTPPAGSYYLGWTSAALSNGAAVRVIHHPQGDVKKISLGNVTGFGTAPPILQASGQFTRAGWTTGTTEGGSSGCALLTFSGSEYLLRGGLLGGAAGCSNSGSLSNPENVDYFSRFDLEFANLQAFLAPVVQTFDYTGAWANAAQSGWGLVVIKGGTGTYAMYIYHYDQDSSPGWYLSAGTLSGNSYNAGVLAFTGPWFGISPFNPAGVASRNAGALAVNFTSATTATVNFTIDGRTVTTTLDKLAF